MQLIQGNPNPNAPRSFSKAERTFTLSPEAMAVLEHLVIRHEADDYELCLNMILLAIDAMAGHLGLNEVELKVSDDGKTRHASFTPKAVVTAPDLKVV